MVYRYAFVTYCSVTVYLCSAAKTVGLKLSVYANKELLRTAHCYTFIMVGIFFPFVQKNILSIRFIKEQTLMQTILGLASNGVD